MIVISLISICIFVISIWIYFKKLQIDDGVNNILNIKIDKQYYIFGISLIFLSTVICILTNYINILPINIFMVIFSITLLSVGMHTIMYWKNVKISASDEGIQYIDFLKKEEFIEWSEVTDIVFSDRTRRLIIECYDIKIKIDVSNNEMENFIGLIKNNLDYYFYSDALNKLSENKRVKGSLKTDGMIKLIKLQVNKYIKLNK